MSRTAANDSSTVFDIRDRRAGRGVERIHAAGPDAPAEPLWSGPAFERIARRVDRLASLHVPVLVRGETGTGKELVVRALHARSRRAEAPFCAINCAAVPGTLLESSLFGHVRGAFTGATDSRQGLFVEAGDGTVFLDEVGELRPEAQAALLRVLETRTVVPVGSVREVPVRARVVAATHRDLAAMVAAGTFREDLLHRLDVVAIELPPLRERREHIRPLARRFLAAALTEVGRATVQVADAVWPALEMADWPGNVRQLRNAMIRAAALCEGEVVTLDDFDLAPAPAAATPVAPAFPTRKQRELDMVREALSRTGGHKARAAALLGMPIRTFRRRLRELERLEAPAGAMLPLRAVG